MPTKRSNRGRSPAWRWFTRLLAVAFLLTVVGRATDHAYAQSAGSPPDGAGAAQPTQESADSSPASPQTVVSDVPNTPEERAVRLESLLRRGQLDAARELADAYPDEAGSRLARARIDITRGEYTSAEATLRPAVEQDPTGEAALRLGLLLYALGRPDEAYRVLLPVYESASAASEPVRLARAARAARAIGRFRQANAWYRAAAAAAPDDPAIATAWGDLFLEKHNRPDAIQSYEAALELDTEYADAHAGLARARLETDPAQAAAAARRALELNPTLIDPRLLLAEISLDDGKRDEARATIEEALAINPSSLEARSLLAATYYLDDRIADFEAEIARVLAINPRFAEGFRIAAEQAAHNYRFTEAVALTRRGVALDDRHAPTLADLGMHLLRTGEEEEARDILNRAFRADPYNVVTYNLLSLFDTLESFQTFEAGPVTVRLHPDEAPVLQQPVTTLANEALTTLSQRYGFTPQGPILLEVFPRHDDFAVRNLGLPGMIGALGACFGRVVTMDSPRARPPGSFNWGATLWHELAHVITLQMSNQRVPRWLTEGISVFEERRARPTWGREGEMLFLERYAEGKLLPLAELNAAFSDPETIVLAYHQGSLVVEHLVETYGQEALHAMLRAYGEGRDDAAAIAAATGGTIEALQASFDRFLESRYSAMRDALAMPPALRNTPLPETVTELEALVEQYPGTFRLWMALGELWEASGDTAGARAAYERAIALVPAAGGEGGPRERLAALAERDGDAERARGELERLLASDHAALEPARKLAELSAEAGDRARHRLALERIMEVDPFDARPYTELGRMALGSGDTAGAIRLFEMALAAGPDDPTAARTDLGESLLYAGRHAEAKRQALAALEEAPRYERAQELLLRAIDEAPRGGQP